jgi:hypothetical protein
MFSPGRNLFDTKEKYFFHEKSSNFIQILTKFNVDNWRVRLFLFCIFQVKIFCSITFGDFFIQTRKKHTLPLKVFYLLNGLIACYLSKNYVNSIFLREKRVIKLYTHELWTLV